MHSFGDRRLIAWRREHLAHVHRIKAVLLAAEIAAHLDLAAFVDQAIAFFAAQAAQHAAYTLA
jgi:hypothetical protein